MATPDDLREHVLNSFRAATDRRFEEAVGDFPPDSMNVKPPNVDYTPWQLLEHLRISQLDILEYVRNPSPTSRLPGRKVTGRPKTPAVMLRPGRRVSNSFAPTGRPLQILRPTPTRTCFQ
jgi:hypothetical protein